MKTTLVYGHAVVDTDVSPVIYTAALSLTGAGLARLRVTCGRHACSPDEPDARRATQTAVARRRWILSTPGQDAPERFRRAFLVWVAQNGAVCIHYATPDPAEQSSLVLSESPDVLLAEARLHRVPWVDVRGVAFDDALYLAQFCPSFLHGPGSGDTRAAWVDKWVHTASLDVVAALWREHGALTGGIDAPDPALCAAARARMERDAARANAREIVVRPEHAN